jgi:D-alanyl-D-alanine carboxypeptidase
MIFSILTTIIVSIFGLSFNLDNLPIEHYASVIEKPPTYHLPIKKAGVSDLDILADSAAVLDIKDNLFIFEKNANEVRRLASITKLMAALVFLDNNPGWDKTYSIQREDRRDGGAVYLYLGEEVTVKDLFYAMLVGSDNTADIALIHASGLTEEDFVQRMNEKARYLGFFNTKFADPVGLSNDNVSTAREVALLVKAALDNPDIFKAVATNEVEIVTAEGQKKTIKSTNYLLNNFSSERARILGGKTGHTDLAGYCLAAKFTDQNQHDIISVVLGADSELERFRQSARLVNWVYDNFDW